MQEMLFQPKVVGQAFYPDSLAWIESRRFMSGGKPDLRYRRKAGDGDAVLLEAG
jgi:hypothetical protein